MSPVLQALAALVPPIGVGLVFWLVIRSIVQADRRERAAMAALDAQARDAASGVAGQGVRPAPAANGAAPEAANGTDDVPTGGTDAPRAD